MSLLQTCLCLLASLAVLFFPTPASLVAYIVYPFTIYREPWPARGREKSISASEVEQPKIGRLWENGGEGTPKNSLRGAIFSRLFTDTLDTCGLKEHLFSLLEGRMKPLAS